MDTIIEAFHVDLKLLIAQTINFTIVFFVLYYFVLKPLIKVMHDRTVRIEKSMKDAEKIDKRLAKTEEEYKKSLATAKKEASEIVKKAHEQAEEKRKESVVKAKEDIGKIINEEKAKIQVEKAKVLKEIKKDMSILITEAMKKILKEKMDNKNDRELIKKVLNK